MKTVSSLDRGKIGIGRVGQIDTAERDLVGQGEMVGDLASGRDAVRRDVETLEGPVRVGEVKRKQIIAVAGSEFDDPPGVAAMTRDQFAERADAISIILAAR